MTKEEWESEFGGGRNIKHEGGGPICVFGGWTGIEADYGNLCQFKSIDGFSCVVSLNSNKWIIVEEPEPQFKEKSIDEFPWVEVSDGGTWYKRRYLYTSRCVYRCLSESGRNIVCWRHMRPLKPANIEDLKQRAKLV